jgi:hypothetical protein
MKGDPNFKIFDAINDLDASIKSFHCVTNLIATSSEKNHIDLDNLYHLLSGIGDNLQRHFSELESSARKLMINS